MRSVPFGVMLALVLSASAHSQVVVPPRDVVRPAATGTAIVSGRVLTQAGTPLRRALVTISEGPLRRQVTTDVDGKYQFAGLPAGRFSINASKAGYVGLQYGQRRPNQPGTPVVVAAGRTVTAIDFTLPRGGVITGRITDEFGDALAQAQVQIGRMTYGPDGQRRAQMNQSATTDDRGEFRAFGLMPGEYIVNAGGRGQVFSPNLTPGNISDVTEGFPATYYPGTPSPDQAETITLGVGEEVSIQFSLVAARLSRVSGIVVNSSGQPAAGANVQVMTRQMSGLLGNGGGTVGPDGSFSIGGIPPGEHSIEIRPVNRPGGAVVQSEFASVPIVVAGQDISGISIVTGRGAMVTGRLVFEGTAARAASPTLRVVAAPVDPTRPQFGSGPAQADNGVVAADGDFQLTGLTGQIFFNAPAPPGWMLKAVTLNGEDITDVPLDVTGKRSVPGVVVTLTDRITELAGQVLDEKGQPTTDATIVLLPAEPLDPVAASRWIRTLRPNTTTGRFQSRGLRAGRYVAVALDYLDQGRQFAPEFQERLRKVGRDVTIREGEPISVDLRLTPGL